MTEPFRENFRRDLFRHFVYQPQAGALKKLSICLLVEGIWAMAVYRFGRALITRGGAAMIFWPVFRIWELLVRLATGIHLDVEARIAPGFYVGHHGAIFVGRGSVIGPDCNIGQMAYVGAAVAAADAAPQIGARVYLGHGCKVIGSVKVGDRAALAPGAVVLEDVPAGTTVIGNPARVVSKLGSDDLVYLGERDPLPTGVEAARLAS